MLQKELYIGIDLGYERAMISLYHTGMKDVETVSTVSGEEKYQIPTAVFVGKQGNYFYGEEALRRETQKDGEFYENLYAECLRETSGTLYRDCLVRFIQRIIRFRERYDFGALSYFLTLTVPELTPEAVSVMQYVRDALGLTEEQFFLTDYIESFFCHTYHQECSVWMHDVALLDFTEHQIVLSILHRDSSNHVSAARKVWQAADAVLLNGATKDEFFANVLREALARRIVSGVYFIGDGFDGGWLKESLRVLGPNKRVFLGKNLYTRGACYTAWRRRDTKNWNFIYDCPYKMQGEISLKVRQGGEMALLPLVDAGKDWFLAGKTIRIIYDGNENLEFWIRKKGERSPRVQLCPLTELPDRPAKAIRLRLEAKPESGVQVRIKVWDDGFGELYPPTGSNWEFSLPLISEKEGGF